MQLEITNDKKLGWNYVKKVMIKITGDSLNYEAPLSIGEITKIHFLTGKILQDYYSGEKK